MQSLFTPVDSAEVKTQAEVSVGTADTETPDTGPTDTRKHNSEPGQGGGVEPPTSPQWCKSKSRKPSLRRSSFLSAAWAQLAAAQTAPLLSASLFSSVVSVRPETVSRKGGALELSWQQRALEVTSEGSLRLQGPRAALICYNVAEIVATVDGGAATVRLSCLEGTVHDDTALPALIRFRPCDEQESSLLDSAEAVDTALRFVYALRTAQGLSSESTAFDEEADTSSIGDNASILELKQKLAQLSEAMTQAQSSSTTSAAATKAEEGERGSVFLLFTYVCTMYALLCGSLVLLTLLLGGQCASVWKRLSALTITAPHAGLCHMSDTRQHVRRSKGIYVP